MRFPRTLCTIFFNVLLVCFVLAFTSEELFAQLPCTNSITITSKDTSNKYTDVICNNNILTITPIRITSTPSGLDSSEVSPTTCPACAYEWSTGETTPIIFAFTPGLYSVTITDSSSVTTCYSVSTFLDIKSSVLSNPMVVGSPYKVCNNMDAELRTTNPCVSCTYEWFTTNPITAVVGATSSNLSTIVLGDYFVEVMDTLGCVANSNILRVEGDIATEPPIVATTTNLCDSNSSTMSTIDCAGCNYRWLYYDLPPEGKLIISGVYDGNRDGAPQGIELYAIGNIPDLSEYSIRVATDNVIPGSANVILPRVSLASGRYYYITGTLDTAQFRKFFGFKADHQSPSLNTNVDGNDAVELYYNSGRVDAFGVIYTPYNPSSFGCTGSPVVCPGLAWNHHEGWAYRNDDEFPTNTFDPTQWDFGPNKFAITNTNAFWKNQKFPLASFDDNTTGSSVDSLIITGIYDGNSNAASNSSGIEIKVLKNIFDLSEYYVDLVLNGTGATQPRMSLPAGPVLAGTYIYITSDGGAFNTFFSTTAIPVVANAASNLALVNGNDCVRLWKKNISGSGPGTQLDQFGQPNYSPSNNFDESWVYKEGWVYRRNRSEPNRSAFNENNWIISSEAFLPTNSVFDIDSMKIKTYENTVIPPSTILQVIPQADTSVYSTDITGYYAVEVQYPNSCIIQSDILLIDTSVFTPIIGSSLFSPNVVTAPTVYADTAYICTGSFVDLYMTGSFELPPSWSYQWYRSTIPVPAATGYNYRTNVAGDYYVEVTNSDGCTVASNVIIIRASNRGANPPISTSSYYICDSINGTVTLTTPGCTNCTYIWNTERGTTASGVSTLNTYEVDDARGYFVQVTDLQSGCTYNSDILEIRDTIYPSPVMTASGNTVCNRTPITLSTDACAGCKYVWEFDTSSAFVLIDTTQQATYQTRKSAKYRVKTLYPDQCETGYSNTIQATFQNINANIATPPVTSICNGDAVIINALPAPDSATCPYCSYTFLRDGVAMQPDTLERDSQTISIAGNYQVIVRNREGCADTSSVVRFEEVNITTNIRKSAEKICSPTSEVIMQIDSCDGCSYQWAIGGLNLITSRDTFYRAYGYAAANVYSVVVSNAGCSVLDSIRLTIAAQRFVKIGVDSSVSNAPIICDGSRVVLVDQCDTCIQNNDYTYQWFSLTDTLIGGSFESFQVDTAGTYFVQTIDSNLCVVLSDTIMVDEFLPDPALELDFATLGTASVVPITYGSFLIDDYLQPASLRSRGFYTSLTAQRGINPTTDSLDVGLAGSGLHFIEYTYVESNAQGSCEFSTMDTIQVLGAVDIDIANTRAGVPASEACIGDTLEITLTNFTFEPDTVIFVAGGGNGIPLDVISNLTQFAGVYSGSFRVVVPIGARTGKLTLTQGNNTFQAPNFFVIQNPAVTIDLVSTIQPICSNLDTATLQGIPAGGTLTASYIGTPIDPTLMMDTFLLLNNVTGYTNGVQSVMVYYEYIPTYSTGAATCPAILDSLLVGIRDAQLDSVQYTPISSTQFSEPLVNLTRTIYPLSSATYPSSYTGTYVLANNLLASSLISNPLGQIVGDSITYQINNGGCINTSVDSITVWPAPSLLDSVPVFLCSQDDTVFIQRDPTGVSMRYRNKTILESLYAYDQNINVSIGNPVEVRYSEYINLMEITTSNGGVDSANLSTGGESYYFVPANVTGTSSRITLKFKYNRVANYFSNGALTRTDTTSYIIAEVSKLFQIENPSVVSINPTILADTIFCPKEGNTQLLGSPSGGSYFINGNNIAYQRVPNNIYNPLDHDISLAYQLTYVYEGRACVDSATTGIFVPDTFAITVRPNNGTGDYCLTSPNDSVFFGLLSPPITRTIIDPSSAQFFVRGIQSATIFSPSQVGPPGMYNVRYVVSDIYGCTEEATDIFEVFPIPVLSISPIDSIFCLNDDTTQIQLYETSNGLRNVTLWPTAGLGVPPNDTVWLDGMGIVDGGQMAAGSSDQPYFSPRVAGVGVHPIRYVYKDENNCMDSINFDIEILPLPQVSMTTTNRRPLQAYYCENDSIPLFGAPVGTSLNSGYGSYVDTVLTPGMPSSLDLMDIAFEPYVAGDSPGIVREWLYYYYEDRNGCRDTAFYDTRIRNFTTDPIIVGFDNAAGRICASDTNVMVLADPNGGFDLDSLGWFTSNFTQAFSQLTDSARTDSITFYPDSTFLVFADKDVILTYNYTDTAKVCSTSVSDTVRVLALPYLTLSERLVTSLPAMDPMGSKLIAPRSDTFYHVCETAQDVPIFAYNTTGFYDFLGNLQLNISDHISSDTGQYVMGRGVVSNTGTTSLAYAYVSSRAGFGLDTIRYVYEDNRGCIDSVDYYIMVDSLPVLSFAGLSNFDSTINRYVYCESEPNPPSILPAPTGVSWTLTFAGENITSVPFDLLPDTLAVAGTYMDYALRYEYIGQIYRSGAVCRDSLLDTIQIRPSPQMAWINAPSDFCMSDSAQRIPLSATPYGGTFVDATNNFQVPAGIVGDSLFNPSAQAGKRDIYYYYLDTISGCDDTIQHTIYVYTQPQINFDVTGGCSGVQAELTARTEPFGLQYNGVAIDSLTQVIWDFGDGVIDTFNFLPDTLTIPSDTHTYFNYGVFYPSLTVVNQGVCDTTFTRRIVISPKVVPYDTLPYVQPFDNANNGWFQASADTLSVNGVVQDSLWEWGIIDGNTISTLLNGNTAWATRLTQTYGQGEDGWVYSPCFDLTNLDRPMIKLDIWRATQEGVDGAVLQYYDDSTQTWTVLGRQGKGINWYQDQFVVSSPGNQTTVPRGWTGNNITWEDARYRLDNREGDLRNRDNIRFRIAFASDPGTLLGVNDGFAFDNVMVGNRTRNVLVEHFSAVAYPAIAQIENELYRIIYSNLYGRDVSLIQYHSNEIIPSDPLYLLNPVDNRQRRFLYNVTNPDEVRVDGKLGADKTSDLLNYPELEILDIESLQDAKFKIEFMTFPNIQYSGPSQGMQATIRVTAMEDLPFSTYSIMATVTKDSLVTLTGHTTMAVLLANFPNNAGTSSSRSWVTGDFVDVLVDLPDVNPTMHPNTGLLQLVAYVQDVDASPKEIYQVETTRDLNIFTGSVDSLDISITTIAGVEATQFKLFPNPAVQQFQVAFDAPLEADYEWQLVNTLGQSLRQGKATEGTTNIEIDTDDLTAGFYVFIIRNKNVYAQRKVIVKKP